MRIVNLTVDLTNRAEIRRHLLMQWLAELHGGGGHIQRYRYNVETLQDGSRIYLMRPAPMHKGCDFAVYCEKLVQFKNGNCRPPTHGVLHTEFEGCLNTNPDRRSELIQALNDVWLCRPVDDIVSSLAALSPALANLLAAERVLKLAKWLFIEQDMNYWTGRGREMLMSVMAEDFGFDPPQLPTPQTSEPANGL